MGDAKEDLFPVTTDRDAARPSICIVGVGPRGTSTVERIAARRPAGPFVIHLIDDAELGSGRVWRTDQPRTLCMNTLAGAVTLFTDDSMRISGPVAEGPTLLEWSRSAADAVTRGGAAGLAAAGLDPRVADFADELAAMRPESHPSRALFGHYLRWCLGRARAALPADVEVVKHRQRAVALDEAAGRRLVRLADGTTIPADAVVWAPGWLPVEDPPADRALVAGPHRVAPGSPIDQDLTDVPAGEPVLVRGLGMGFFDTVTLLTEGRGGRFVAGPQGLAYEASGREPVLHVTSRRGLPFRSKSRYGGLPPRPAHTHLRSVDWTARAAEARERPIDFGAEMWPLIQRDGYAGFVRTLARVRPAAAPGGFAAVERAVAQAPLAELPALLAELLPDPADRFDLAALMRPADRAFASPREFDAFVAAYIADDLREADLGADSPLKAGLWEIQAARRTAAQVLAFAAADPVSFRTSYREFAAFGAMVGSGPPAFRNEELLALHRAGLVHFVGAAATVVLDDGRYRARSPWVEGSAVAADTLVDAWMYAPDFAATSDPFARSLAGQELTRAFRLADGSSGRGWDVAPDGAVTGSDGTPDEALWLLGIPVEEARGDTAISPMPRVNATMLRETDAAAAAALARVGRLTTPAVPPTPA